MVKYDFKSLNDKLLSIRAYQQIIPGGTITGHDYIVKNPTRNDKNAGSFSINVDTGGYFDHATGDQGHDLISLYAYVNSIENGKAFKELSEKYSNVELKPIAHQEVKPKMNLVSPVPENAAPLPTHRVLPQLDANGKQIEINGKKQWWKFPITHYWPYHTAEGQISHYVVRYYHEGKQAKETPPMCWSSVGKWDFHALPEPRILFNLHLIKKYPTAQLLIVEGEKSADAATKLFTEAGKIEQVVPVTWQGGAASIYKTDWTPLKNRLVILWPDNDLQTEEDSDILIAKEKQAGYVAMLNIAGILCENSENRQKVKFLDPDQTKPHTWDVADAILDEHWTASQVFAFIKPRLTGLPEELPKPQKNKCPNRPQINNDTSNTEGNPWDHPELFSPGQGEQNNKNSTPQIYYSRWSKEYIIEHKRGWLMLQESQIKNELALLGYSKTKGREDPLSPADKKIVELRHECDVDFAGELAGCLPGLYTRDETRLLITKGPRLVDAKPGNCDLLLTFFEELLFNEFPQADYFLGWLKIAVEALYCGSNRPGQAIAFVGERGNGKSLSQNIITEILGGRSAKPYQYMSGATNFNDHLVKAEHLMIEDEQGSSDIRIRRQFGQALKQITACDSQQCYKKFCDPIMLRPFWRLTISLNDEPENLLVLPLIDPSIEDKISIFKTQKPSVIPDTSTIDGRENFWNALISQIPAFLQFLNDYEIPLELRSGRYGVTHFHHPDVLEELGTMSPEGHMLQLIDRHLWKGSFDAQWSGTAAELEKILIENCSREALKLFTWNNACGIYLGRLSKKHPERFINHRTESERSWIIRKK